MIGRGDISAGAELAGWKGGPHPKNLAWTMYSSERKEHEWNTVLQFLMLLMYDLIWNDWGIQA
jgi:hypothetical protein